MKKTARILILVLAFTLTTQAQKRDRRERMDNLTTAQKATLAIKKMTLELDLSNRQQKQLKPILMDQIADRMATRVKMNAMRDSGKRPTDEEKFAMANDNLDKKIAFKNSMKQILNNKQFEEFEKIAKKREGKMKRGMKKMRESRRDSKERE